MHDPSEAPVRVVIVGDFDPGKHSHWATEAALFHAAAKLGISVAPQWLPTTAVESTAGERALADCHGIWAAPGSPFASMRGMLRAIEYARTRDVVFIGTCAGFQHALIEFTRNVLGIADADSAENQPQGENIVITPVACAAPDPLRPRLAGTGVARPAPGSLLEQLCGPEDLRAQYFCSMETNPRFVARWQAAGLRVAAVGGDAELRAFELPDKRFFMATLFQPQLSSAYDRPHPIISGYLRACTTSSRS